VTVVTVLQIIDVTRAREDVDNRKTVTIVTEAAPDTTSPVSRRYGLTRGRGFSGATRLLRGRVVVAWSGYLAAADNIDPELLARAAKADL
jgi:hypothetical protein